MYYKDTQDLDRLYFLQDTNFSSQLPASCMAITDEEADIIKAAQAATQAAAQAARPKVNSFIQGLKDGPGGIVAANTLVTAYPLLIEAIKLRQWIDVEQLVLDAKNKSVIDNEQYTTIKVIAATNNIPITLP